jgi:hypothetical protein
MRRTQDQYPFGACTEIDPVQAPLVFRPDKDYSCHDCSVLNIPVPSTIAPMPATFSKRPLSTENGLVEAKVENGAITRDRVIAVTITKISRIGEGARES